MKMLMGVRITGFWYIYERADEHIGFWPYMSVLMKADELANICTKIQYAHEHPHIYTKIQYPHENAHNLVHI
jgi:hypothetical protein